MKGVRLEIRMQLDHLFTAGKRRAAAGFKIAFDRKALSQQDLVTCEFDVEIRDCIDRCMNDRPVVHQVFDRHQHVVDEHGMIRRQQQRPVRLA
jgi:hypothetical protein